jgi:hypothetical protein
MFAELEKITLGNKELFMKVLAAHAHTLKELIKAIEHIEQTRSVDIEAFSKIAHKAKTTLLTLQQQKLVFRIYEWIEQVKTGNYQPPDFINDCKGIANAVDQKLSA